jgi:hypothetical protein
VKEIVDKVGRRYTYNRPLVREQAKNAILAARYAIEQNLPREEAAKKFSVGTDSISRAHTILTHGTPEEAALVEAGTSSLRDVYETVLKRTPKDQRREGRKRGVRGEITKEQDKAEAAIWSTLKDALDSICSLPQPEDVVKIVRKNRIRATGVDKKLMTTFTWITEFSDAWTK